MKILIIEDDPTIRTELSELLNRYGYETTAPEEFTDVVNFALKEQPHLILLDLGLPVQDGYHICREIRKQASIPIIVVTSRNTELDELMSMNLGADDFVTKPYHVQILLVRIENLLRRSYKNTEESVVELGGVSLNRSRSMVSKGDMSAELTKNEQGILYLLMQNEGRIISRDRIMEELWESDEFVDDNTLTVNINRLRKKLEQIGAEDFITTKRGQGYACIVSSAATK
ncbi:DNA-binding response regulator [Clostridia bacterium]|nr:DNA-binding response regulator [Clostridia bacterium]